MTKKTVFMAVAFIWGASSAQAYIGPGLGAGAIAAVFGAIASVFIAVFAIFYYPIKRALKKRKKVKKDQ